MSNNFTGIRAFPFRGATYRLPVKLPAGVAYPSNRVPPSVCPVTIDWNVYWQLSGNANNVAVELNLQAASVQASILDRIASVKIDNTGSPNSVYVQFPDTGDVINCPPNCSVTYPCLTNLLSPTIIALGLTPGFIPTTRIFFYNINLPPSVDYEVNQTVELWKASPTITRGSTILNTNYGTPALGDQFFASSILDVGSFSTAPLWNTPYASGFLYITAIFLNVIGVQETTGQRNVVINIESTGVAGVLAQPQSAFFNGNTQLVQLLNMPSMQLKLDATQTWRMRVVAGVDHGGAQLFSSFTQSPI
jgi:hypothetical protein